jgi:hypothetical protein
LHTISGRKITAQGIKPIDPTQWQRDNFYLYGALEPLTGESFFYEFTHLDGSCFQLFLDHFSAMLGDTTAILQLDRGSFHTTPCLDWPENIIPLLQPPHCPELNPIERLWGYLKAQLRWENCSTLDELRLRLSQVLEHLTADVIQSLAGWDFILSALLSSSS